MASKYYVVAKGRIPGIYRSWSECRHQVKGFSRAMYKSFKIKRDAEEWLSKYSDAESTKKRFSIYTDGSCIKGKIGAGVYFSDVKIGYTSDVPPSDGKDTISRAEVYAIELALIKAPGVPLEIFIDSDYARNCCTGAWTVRVHKDIFNKIESLAKEKDIRWSSVDGHSNNIGNDRADELAKRGVKLDNGTFEVYRFD
uniref:Ribonuclease H n=1 Tax=Pithovirus LCDPAC01 TaxID=2506600 RepID=A0A481YNN5_9VIRU|nr:MAG: ribonuclease H [Pithovirus LCDPAC01]